MSIGPATNTAVVNNLIYDNIDRGVRLESDAFSSYVWRNVIDGNGEGVHLRGGPLDASTSNAIHGNVISYSNSRWNVSSSFVAGNVGTYNHVWNNCLYATNPDPSFNSNGGIIGASSTRGFDVVPADARGAAVRRPRRARLPPRGRQPVPRHER